MSRRSTRLDNLIGPCLDAVVQRAAGSYFHKDDVVAEVMSRSNVANMITDLERRYRGWGFGDFIQRSVEQEVTKHLQKRDRYKVRLYECYQAGARWRWLRLSTMNAAQLRSVIAATNTQIRSLENKVTVYQGFLEQLEGLPDPTATVADVYDGQSPPGVA